MFRSSLLSHTVCDLNYREGGLTAQLELRRNWRHIELDRVVGLEMERILQRVEGGAAVDGGAGERVATGWWWIIKWEGGRYFRKANDLGFQKRCWFCDRCAWCHRLCPSWWMKSMSSFWLFLISVPHDTTCGFLSRPWTRFIIVITCINWQHQQSGAYKHQLIDITWAVSILWQGALNNIKWGASGSFILFEETWAWSWSWTWAWSWAASTS